MPPKIHHLGIAVESLAEAVPVFEKLLGQKPSSQEEVADQKVRIAVFSAGESRIELLESTTSDSPVAKFLSRRGPGIHHLTLTVPNLEQALADLKASGFKLVDQAPRTGAAQEKIAFLHPSSTAGILIELLEEKNP
ncbi:MAG TPA: methylmalonyl-CoA epimerase [Terriglobia bacterium]|nr:methylmalonyl-CoA epimerase [Terriglobia bacterium]